MISALRWCSLFFFFNDTATTEIYTLSLHDALPILVEACARLAELLLSHCPALCILATSRAALNVQGEMRDRKSTRLNSSHLVISYAVFCLKKKKHRTRLRLIQTNITTPAMLDSCTV